MYLRLVHISLQCRLLVLLTLEDFLRSALISLRKSRPERVSVGVIRALPDNARLLDLALDRRSVLVLGGRRGTRAKLVFIAGVGRVWIRCQSCD